jgi:two-component system response regulator AtoC
MNNNMMKILIIDDEPGIHEIIGFSFKSDFMMYGAFSGEEGLKKVETIFPDIIFLDMIMPGINGMTCLKRLVQKYNNIPVIVFTGYGSIDSAVHAIKLGAIDYIEKPLDILKLRKIVIEVLKGRKSFQDLSSCHNIMGESPQIQKVWQLIEKFGPSDLPILIHGETGTGKELFAKAIHEISKRKRGPFVPVDCSVLPETLFESEIFGYEKGAFTGANSNKPGQLDWANEGTFFIDEISNLSMQYQAKLLRVIQERQYVPLGGHVARAVDVRFITASNVDLTNSIEHEEFREDLYYRISGCRIELPPLRNREGDIEILAHHFVNTYAMKYNKPIVEISDEAMDILLAYPWPGNVRELEHAMGVAVVASNRIILPDHLPPNVKIKTSIHKGNGNGKVNFELNFKCDIMKPVNLKKLDKKIIAEVEKLVIMEVKKHNSISQLEMASFFGLDPKTLRAKLKDIKDSQGQEL